MKSGFTLIEVMTAVAILGILSSIAFVSLDGSRQKGRDAVRVGDLKSLALAAEKYFSEYHIFPPDIAALDQYFESGGANSAPKDPKGTSYSYLKLPYGYCVGGNMEISVPSPTSDPVCPPSLGNYIIKGP